ncbi:MAG: DUF3617 domain-containing protein [Burkholderiales bacterium]
MKRLRYLLLIALYPASSFAALPDMQEGMWEITTKIEISGLPQNLPAHTIQHCVTKKDIEEGKLLKPEQKNSNCQLKDYKVEGNKASWSVACTGANPMTGNGSVIYSGASFAGATKMKMGGKGRETEMAQSFSGKRIGECKK